MRCGRRLILLVALAGAAERAARADPCIVTVDGPDDAREAIATWMVDEPTCGPPLIVHVVPGDGAFEVTASDTSGRQFARLAPDVQTVAALVASWAAADVIVHDPVATAPSPPPRVPRRSVSVAAMLGREYGVRLDADAVLWDHLVIGVSASLQFGSLNLGDSIDNFIGSGPNEQDVSAFATIGYEHELLGWRARATAGVGVQVTTLQDEACFCDLVMGGPLGSQMPTTLFAVQGSVTLSHALGADWELMLGASVTVLPHSLASAYVVNNWYDEDDLGHVSPAGLLGAGYRW
jgi:hypothetical protein